MNKSSQSGRGPHSPVEATQPSLKSTLRRFANLISVKSTPREEPSHEQKVPDVKQNQVPLDGSIMQLLYPNMNSDQVDEPKQNFGWPQQPELANQLAVKRFKAKRGARLLAQSGINESLEVQQFQGQYSSQRQASVQILSNDNMNKGDQQWRNRQAWGDSMHRAQLKSEHPKKLEAPNSGFQFNIEDKKSQAIQQQERDPTAQQEEDLNDLGPLRLNTIDPLMLMSMNTPGLLNPHELPSQSDFNTSPLPERGQFNFNKRPASHFISNQHGNSDVLQAKEEETNNMPVRIKGQEAKAKATEAYTRAEKEIRKYDISIDQFKQRQWVKNPIARVNLIAISVVYLALIVIAFPIAVYGIEARSCNLEHHSNFHVYFVFVVMVALIVTDLYAYLHHRRILDILSQQSPLYQPPIQPSELTFCALLGHIVVFIVNLLCSGCQLYELYSDILIALVSLFNNLPSAFGFFAVILPIINRMIQLYACIKMFTNGMKMGVKTIGTEKVDKLLIYLSLFNMSRLMFPHFNDHKPRWLTVIIVKECLMKLLQIVLKLVLITPTLSEDCSDNITILSFMIIANLLSAVQMVFYATQKYPKKQEEVEYQNLNDLNVYYKEDTCTFEATIVNANQDAILKKINAFVFQPRFVTRTISISFQNLSPLIQPRYRENFFTMLSKYQQFNFKLRELRIFDSTLNFTDFKSLSAIITQVPKLESLVLDNICIRSPEGEAECIGQLKYGVERNKNFKNLTLRFKTTNKAKLLDSFSSMYNLNQQLSIAFVSQYTPIESKRSLLKYRANDNHSQSNAHQPTHDPILPQDVNPEDSLLYPLYDDSDLTFFVESRKADKNHKLFVFRDWENLLRRLYLVKSKNLTLSELPSFHKQSLHFKREIEMFIFWIQYLIQKNQQLSSLSIRLTPSEGDTQLAAPHKLTISLPAAETIVEELLENESNNIQSATFIHNSAESLMPHAQFDPLMHKVLNLSQISSLTIENIKIEPLSFFSTVAKSLTRLNMLTLTNSGLQSLDGIQCLQRLSVFSCKQNLLSIDDQEVFNFLVTSVDHLDLADQQSRNKPELFDIDRLAIPNEGPNKSALQTLCLKGNLLDDDGVCRLVLEVCFHLPCLIRLNLHDSQLSDISIPFFRKYFSCRQSPLQMLDLSKNYFSIRVLRLIKQSKCLGFNLSENYIAVEKCFQPNDDEAHGTVQILQLSKQYQLEEKPEYKQQEGNTQQKVPSLNQLNLKGNQLLMIDLKPFRALISLELAHLGIEEFPIQLMVSSIMVNDVPIQHLDLSGNNVGHNGCKLINVFAQRNKTLKSLRLDSARIRCIGLSYLWIAFSDQDDDLSLDYLSVKNNGIDVGWAKRLNYKLCQPLKVRHLDLSENRLGDRATKDLTNYFESNKHLEVLDLSKNGMTREGLRHVKEIVYRNAYVKELIVRDNLDIDESVEMCERRARAIETSQKIIYY